MNNALPLLALRFVLLVAAQILIFNHLNVVGYLNPFVYVIFILLYPLRTNQEQFLLVSFFLGLIIGLFSDSGGIHAAASVTTAFVRPTLLKLIFGLAYDYLAIKFDFRDTRRKLVYLGTLIFVHHYVVILLERFTFSNFFMSVGYAMMTSIVTLISCIILLILFKYKS